MSCPRCRDAGFDGAAPCAACGFVPPIADAPPSVSEAIEAMVRRKLSQEYRIESLLGRGGMSLVYLARELELNRLVALKVLPLQLSFSDDAAERFTREARIAASLDHPHIVPIFRVGVTSTFMWYSMKYISGATLATLLRGNRPLELKDCLAVLTPVARALHYAHRRGVIHRDVKPGNILIDQEGWVVVADFGVAKAFGGVPLTQSGSTLGTPGYMSPEQCYGRSLDGRSDQYSLAVAAYECLAGAPPFVADSIGEYVRLHCTEPPPPLRAKRPDLAPAVADAVARALSKDPNERFPDALQFVGAMGADVSQALSAGTPVPLAGRDAIAAPPTPHTVPPRPSGAAPAWRARPRWIGVAALTVIGLGLLLLGLPPSRSAPEFGQAPITEATGQAQAAAADRRPTTPVEAARLFVSTDPVGTLYVDGRKIGPTPQIAVPLTPGRRLIRVERDGFEPYEEQIEVAEGEEVRRTRIVLRPLNR